MWGHLPKTRISSYGLCSPCRIRLDGYLKMHTTPDLLVKFLGMTLDSSDSPVTVTVTINLIVLEHGFISR